MSTDTVESPRVSLAGRFELTKTEEVAGFRLPQEHSPFSTDPTDSTPYTFDTPKFGKNCALSWRKHLQDSDERPKSTREMIAELEDILVYTDFLGISEPVEILEVHNEHPVNEVL